MHKTKALLLLCLSLLGADWQLCSSTVSDKSKHEALTNFINLWHEILLFASDLSSSLETICPDRPIVHKSLNDHFYNLKNIDKSIRNISELQGLIGIIDQIMFDLRQIDVFFKHLRLLYKMEGSKYSCNSQLEIHFADAQAQIYLEPIHKRLCFLMAKVEEIKEIIYTLQIYTDSTGRNCLNTYELGFSSREAARKFDPTILPKIKNQNLDKFSQIPNEEIFDNKHFNAKKREELGIISMRHTFYQQPNPRMKFIQKHEYPQPQWRKHKIACWRQTIKPQQTQRFDPVFAVGPDNLSISCQPFSSTNYEFAPQVQNYSDPRNDFAIELDRVFSRPNALSDHLPKGKLESPKSLDLARDELISGSRVHFASCQQESDPTDCTDPSDSSSVNPNGNENSKKTDNSEQSKQDSKKDSNKEEKLKILEDNFFDKTKSEMTNVLYKDGLFRDLSHESNVKLCQIGGHLYALGAQLMAEKLEDYIEEKDAFFNRIQLDHATNQNILRQLSKPIFPEDKAVIAKHYSSLGQSLPGDLFQEAKEVNSLCLMRIQNAVEEFKKGMPLPKDFLRQLTEVEWQKLINHGINTLGLAVEANTYLVSMHEFTNVATRVGYRMGYQDTMERNSQEIGKLKEEIAQKNNEIKESKVVIDDLKNKLETTEAQNKNNSAFSGLVAKKIGTKINDLNKTVETLKAENAALSKKNELLSQNAKAQIPALLSVLKNKQQNLQTRSNPVEEQTHALSDSKPSSEVDLSPSSNRGPNFEGKNPSIYQQTILDDEKDSRIKQLEARIQELENVAAMEKKVQPIFLLNNGKGVVPLKDEGTLSKAYEKGIQDGQLLLLEKQEQKREELRINGDNALNEFEKEELIVENLSLKDKNQLLSESLKELKSTFSNLFMGVDNEESS